MFNYSLVILVFLLSRFMAVGQTQDDTLIGVVDEELIKINKNTGSITNFLPVTGIPAGSITLRLTWSEPDQCFYTLAQAYPPVLAKIDLNGNFTMLGPLTISPGALFMCEGISFNRFDGELYVSGSLNGNPNSNPADYYSETILRVDVPTLSTTAIGTIVTPTPTTSEADEIVFDDNGMLYFYDGQPGQFNQIYKQDMSFTALPTLMYSSGYDPIRGFTVKGNELFLNQNRVLKKINTSTFQFSSVGTMFTSSDFNGQFVFGITWRTSCPSASLFGNDTTICSGQSITLSPSIIGSSYLWQDGSINSSIDASAGGMYSVEVSDGSCTYLDSILVTVEYAPIVDLGNDTTLCGGETLLLEDLNANGVLSWQDGSANSSFLVNQTGVYWLSATNQCGTSIDSIDIAYGAELLMDLGNDTSICSGSSVLLTATGGADSYLWQDGSFNSTTVASAPGVYWVEATLDGCNFVDSIVILLGDPEVVDLGPDLLLCIGESALLAVDNFNVNVEWSDGSNEPAIQTNGDGLYSVITSNMCGMMSDSILIQSEECFCVLYLPNTFTPNGDEYNSSFGPLYDCVIFDYFFEIYNRWGQLVFNSSEPAMQWDATYKGAPVQDGVYIYKIIYSTEEVIGEMVLGHVNVIR